MDIKIDEIVKQVLSEIDAPSRPVQPKTTFVLEETPALTGREVGKTAVLDSQEDYMIKNYVLPEVGPKEILVCVEGCMISERKKSSRFFCTGTGRNRYHRKGWK